MNDELPAEELRRQYDRALDEYRFQVDLNWRRSEYFFVLNVGVLIAAATMFSSDSVPSALAGALFLIGALLAGLSILANQTQHTYYAAARSLKAALEDKLRLDDLALTTTPGQGSPLGRFGRVGTFLKIMLVTIALVDLGGAGLAVAEIADNPDPDPVTALVDLPPAKRGAWMVVVISDGKAVASSRVRSPAVPLEVPPGDYLLSLAGQSVCREEIEITSAPLQVFAPRC